MAGVAQHEQLVGLMSRLLRDDGKRSLELAQSVVQIFYIFSTFSQFHPVILNNQVSAPAQPPSEWMLCAATSGAQMACCMLCGAQMQLEAADRLLNPGWRYDDEDDFIRDSKTQPEERRHRKVAAAAMQGPWTDWLCEGARIKIDWQRCSRGWSSNACGRC